MEKCPKLNSEETKEQIKKHIYLYDAPEKSLTGRTPEIIEEETGFLKEDIFPKDKQILYVGDPWQRMGREINDSRLKIIDYEFGETASFIGDEKSFREEIIYEGENLLYNIEQIKDSIEDEQDKKELEKLYELVKNAFNLLKAEDLEFYESFYENDEYGGSERKEKKEKLQKNYKKIADAWTEARVLIEKKHNQDKTLKDETEIEQEEKIEKNHFDELSDLELLYKNAWYKCVEGERGFKDIPDWHNIVIPKLDKALKEIEQEKMRELTEEEFEKFADEYKKKFIDEIRLKKRTDKAEVLQARFPELPFKNDSFDRFVASWSISAHIFDKLNQKEFSVCWKEIARVLAEDGEAYIFPLNYYFEDKNDMIESLKKISTEENFSWEIYDGYTHVMTEDDVREYGYDAYTLRIKMNGNK